MDPTDAVETPLARRRERSLTRRLVLLVVFCVALTVLWYADFAHAAI